jgi:hypothetical protein
MAKDVFRITPRVAQTIRAIEDKVQDAYNRSLKGRNENAMRAVFNYGDFKFREEDNFTVAEFEKVELMFTLTDDREFAILSFHCRGEVYLRKYASREPGEMLYSAGYIELETLPTGDMKEMGPMFVRLTD